MVMLECALSGIISTNYTSPVVVVVVIVVEVLVVVVEQHSTTATE